MVDRAILCLASRNNMLILATTIETLQQMRRHRYGFLKIVANKHFPANWLPAVARFPQQT